MSDEEELPILPKLEAMEDSIIVIKNNDHNNHNSNTNTNSDRSSSNNKQSSVQCKNEVHKRAVRTVMEELAASKEHIDRTVLNHSSNFNGRPCLNMKDFMKLIQEKSKRQQNLDALYNLVENDSDSIIGFVEFNGLSFIDEWLDLARKEHDDWFALCILQFLAHKNLSITYEALQTAQIAKTVKHYINPLPVSPTASSLATNGEVAVDPLLSPQSIPRLTESIKQLLPSDLNVTRANDNFVDKIDRNVIYKVCKQEQHTDAIRYLQSQFASRIVNKWKKFIGDWKKQNNRPNYRHVKFADEKAKQLASCAVFRREDAPMSITQEQDKKRREKMAPTIKWTFPYKLQLETYQDIDGNAIELGRDSVEKNTQSERVQGELEEFSIGSEHLKDPKSLASNRQTVPTAQQKPCNIPLENEQSSPSPDKAAQTAPSQPVQQQQQQQTANTQPAHLPLAAHPQRPVPYPPPPNMSYPPPPHHAYPPYAAYPPPPPGHPSYTQPPNYPAYAHANGHHAPPPHPAYNPHVGYPPGYPPHHIPGYPPYPHPPSNGALQSQQPQQAAQAHTNGHTDSNGKQVINIPEPGGMPMGAEQLNGKRIRKREFSDVRPSKRQKINERYNELPASETDGYRRDMRPRERRKRHKRHGKNRRDREHRRKDDP